MARNVIETFPSERSALSGIYRQGREHHLGVLPFFGILPSRLSEKSLFFAERLVIEGGQTVLDDCLFVVFGVDKVKDNLVTDRFARIIRLYGR